ncbi:hypothetical protein LBMAG42_46220 [Deltaproteobacteria bacterium]|nr:hypothetical protein LBMAG42_46220 [Deltaproteobacteria bacterium]
MDDRGDGLVLIWGWGLPFLCPPVTASPVDHPSINLAVYRDGRAMFYHLEALDPGRVSRCPGGWRFGDNLLQSRRTADGWAVDAELDLPVAGSHARARGEIRLRGPAVNGIDARGGPHVWAPISMVAEATAHLNFGGEDVRFSGRGYHDENVGERPMPALGIREWAWGRVAEPDSEVLHYRCEGESGAEGLEVVIDDGGRATVRPIEIWSESGRLGGTYGFAGFDRLAFNGRVIQAGPLVDESAFYLRFPLSTTTGRGWGERVRPGAIAAWWMRPLVRMCVTTPNRPSALLPLFSGPAADRLSRTLSWWTGPR